MPSSKLYTLVPQDPNLFSGCTQQAAIETSWSRGMIALVSLVPAGISALIVHPYLASAGKLAMDDIAKYVKKYEADMLIVGKLEEIR